MFTTRLSRILLAGLVCLLVLPLFRSQPGRMNRAKPNFAPTKESPYEGIPGRLRYNVRIVLVEQDKQGNYIARRDSSTVSKRQLAATVIAAARYYAQRKRRLCGKHYTGQSTRPGVRQDRPCHSHLCP